MRSPLKFRDSSIDEGDVDLAHSVRLTYDPAAFAGHGPADSLKSQFPEVEFIPQVGGGLPSGFHIAFADVAAPKSVEKVTAELSDIPAGRVIVILKDADVATTRALVRGGAFDVLSAPASDLALAVSLERLMAQGRLTGGGDDDSASVVTFLKAGGGSGATSLAVQTAAHLARKHPAKKICVVDLDIQFGQAALYLDVEDSITMSQVLVASDLTELPFVETLKPHATGARVLAAPSEFMPLESLSTDRVDSLITALKSQFDLVLIDLPSAWTEWSYRVLRHSDRIVLLTQLSVPHAHLAKRQLGLLEIQRLGDVPLTLVCNRVGKDSAAGVSVRSVESAIERKFDVVVPEEARLMNEAINQGVAISQIRRGSKIEKAIEQLAECIVPARAQAKRQRK